MAEPLRYEEVSIGMEVPALIKETSSRMSARWAAASGDYDPIHYDRTYALNQKLPDIIVNGRLKIALLSQMMINWIGPQGSLEKIGAIHRGMDIVNDAVACKGEVVKKYVENGRKLLECRIWTENRQGEKTAQGNAVVALP
ncbi:MAG: hypothetical protein C3F14_04885 [Deltaproteobacteria bacterium]|nr:MAG: hypothetical protein C3F14_04885 [Deltaproteobacteria bacterium]